MKTKKQRNKKKKKEINQRNEGARIRYPILFYPLLLFFFFSLLHGSILHICNIDWKVLPRTTVGRKNHPFTIFPIIFFFSPFFFFPPFIYRYHYATKDSQLLRRTPFVRNCKDRRTKTLLYSFISSSTRNERSFFVYSIDTSK